MTRCSDAARERGDDLEASAPPTRRWLLLELPGPWGPRGLVDCRLSRPVAQALQERADADGMRVLLIRRAGRVASADDGRRWAVVDQATASTTWGRWDSERQLVDDPLPGPSDTNRTAVDGPSYLVCTHGRHDVCCAVRGRPVAQALAAIRPSDTWECSHVGGDRFAANVVVLPWGLYYGDVEGDEVGQLVALTEQGRLLLSRFRGRTGTPLPAQAAQQHVRREMGIDERDALAVDAVDAVDADNWLVRLAGQPPLTVTRTRVGIPTGLTCAASGPSSVWRWSVTPVA